MALGKAGNLDFPGPIFPALPSAMTIALGKGFLCRVLHSAKWPKLIFFVYFFHSVLTNKKYHIYITYLSHLAHIYHIHHNIYNIIISNTIYITYSSKQIHRGKSKVHHSLTNLQVHHKYITSPPSEQQMQTQLLFIKKGETERLVKKKRRHLQAHEPDYSNPPIEAAQRRRDCMC